MTDYNIPMDGWLCIWRFGYECNAKMIENGDEAIEFFTENTGFEKEDIVDILALEEGEIWDGDVNGLVIVKMNRRIEEDDYTKLKVMLGELAEATEIYDPTEITQFTYEHGYYSALAELGKTMDDDEYDSNRFKEVNKIFSEYLAQKFRR